MAIAPQLDVLGYLRDASRTGAAIGAQMFNNTLRMQQLQSEQALQRLREQQMAQELAFKLEAHDLALQERADLQKAQTRFELSQIPLLPAPAEGPPVAGGQQPTAFLPNPAFNPNPGDAFLQAFSSVPKTMEGQRKLLLDAATINLRTAQALDEQAMAETRGQPRPRTPEQIEGDKALTEQRRAAAELSRARTEAEKTGRSGTAPIIERKMQLYEEAVKAGDQTRIQAYENDLGLNRLNPFDKARYDTEIEALDRDFQTLGKPEAYLKKRLEIVEKYFKKVDGGAATSASGAPGTRTNPLKFDWKDGKLRRMP